jgi:hypothetical protein
MAFDRAAAEDALHARVVAALGLAAGQVIWDGPNAPSPAKPFATLKLVGPSRLGLGGALTDATNLANPPGEEVEITLTEHQEWVLTVQLIAGATSGASSAAALLGAAVMKLRLPSALEQLRVAGVAVIEVGDTQDLSALFASDIESRAKLDVRLRTMDTATEKTGYIDTVGIASPWGSFDAP